jgi:hypothetical protein
MKQRREVIVSIAVAAIILIILIASGGAVWAARSEQAKSNVQLQAAEAALAKSRVAAAAKDRYILDVTRTIDEVHNELLSIIPAELQIEQTVIDVEQKQIAVTRRTQLLGDLDKLSSHFASQRMRLDLLQTRLQNASVRMTSLEQTVSHLRTAVSARENRIADLQEKLGEVSKRVRRLEKNVLTKEREIAGQNEVIAERNTLIGAHEEKIKEMDSERHRAYLRYGTMEELEGMQLVTIVRKGVLRRRTPQLVGKYQPSSFDPIDIRSTSFSIPYPSARLALLTAQPASSYAFVETAEGSRLEIRDPSFWDTARYVVVLVK